MVLFCYIYNAITVACELRLGKMDHDRSSSVQSKASFGLVLSFFTDNMALNWSFASFNVLVYVKLADDDSRIIYQLC